MDDPTCWVCRQPRSAHGARDGLAYQALAGYHPWCDSSSDLVHAPSPWGRRKTAAPVEAAPTPDPAADPWIAPATWRRAAAPPPAAPGLEAATPLPHRTPGATLPTPTPRPRPWWGRWRAALTTLTGGTR
ncbi:hypothetical protein [Nocardiopsis sp. NPDC057823]|uniref:hypothetical protein n=1 Tax=Nocardiopsis sp. NPDC057823 TaxID=3346256 RepID=UPI00366A8838